MTITYQNGHSEEGIILSRNDTQMRVIRRNSDDVLALQLLSGTWVTEDLEPVTVELASRLRPGKALSQDSYVCSAEMAAHLIHLLLTDSGEDLKEAPAAPPQLQHFAAAARTA